MEYAPYPEGQTPQQREALLQERIRLMARHAYYNDPSNRQRPKSVIAIRITSKGNPRLFKGQPREEYFETVKAAARAMRTTQIKIMSLAGKKLCGFSRKWHYATEDDLARLGIL